MIAFTFEDLPLFYLGGEAFCPVTGEATIFYGDDPDDWYVGMIALDKASPWARQQEWEDVPETHPAFALLKAAIRDKYEDEITKDVRLQLYEDGKLKARIEHHHSTLNAAQQGVRVA